MTARYIVGDVREVLATLEPETVDLVLTSPPFLALRSYLPVDHPDKPLEIGSEPTPGAYIDTLLDVVELCARVLAPHGSMCFELGDTYSGSGGAGGDYNENGLREGQPRFDGSASKAYGTGAAPRPPRCCSTTNDRTEEESRLGVDARNWPEPKSLCLIPEIFRFSLVYGHNPLTGRTTPRWRARNIIRWCRPNPPVGALGDKFRPATSEMVVLCKDRRRYFDLDAVRTPLTEPGAVKTHSTEQRNPSAGWDSNQAKIHQNPAGAPPLDWWKISTQPYEGSHYATFPEELCVIPIKAMCPIRVCRTCGKPSERIVSDPEYERTDSDRVPARLTMLNGQRPADGVNQHIREDGANTSVTRRVETLGWTDCGHDNWRNGLCLDPFAGSGTALQVATGHGRDAIGIDLDPRNAELALERVGPLFLTVEYHLAKELA